MRRVVDQDGQLAIEQPVVAFDGDVAEHDVLFFRNDGRDVVHNAQVILSHHMQRDGISAAAFAGPTHFHHAIGEAFAHLAGVRAAVAVDFDAARNGDKTEDLVAVNRVAATCHLELHAFQIAVVDHQNIFLSRIDRGSGVGETEGFGTAHFGSFRHTGFALLQLDIGVERSIEIDFVFGYVGVKVTGFLITQFLDELVQGTFVPFELAILQFSLEHFASHGAVATFHFAQGLTNLRTGVRRHHDVQPFEARLLGVRGENFDTLSTAQRLTKRNILAVDDTTDAAVADFRVNEIGEIQYGAADGQLKEVAFGREDVD